MDWDVWNDVLLGVLVFAVASVGGLAVIGLVLVRLRSDYFCDASPRRFWAGKHPLIRGIGLLLKNLLGVSVVAIGILLALPGVPGPGILTILLGMMLLDFPGRRGLERWIITRPQVFGTLNRVRRKFDRPPLRLDSTETESPREFLEGRVT